MDQESILRGLFADLRARATNGFYYTYSNFLTLAEQDLLLSMKSSPGDVARTLCGGYDTAERRIAVFGSEADFGYTEPPPIAYLCAEPKAPKFAEELTHRDVLGSILALGIERDVTGDIIISDNCAYIICLDHIAELIASDLTRIKHTDVICRRIDDLPKISIPSPPTKNFFAASERADVLISAVYGISRSESERLFSQKLVFENSRAISSSDAKLKPGSIISVRGKGRFLYEGVSGTTKKGRLIVLIKVYK